MWKLTVQLAQEPHGCNFLTAFGSQGDVFKTRGGGQAVQFTEIETLKQESPTGWVVPLTLGSGSVGNV